MVASELPRFDFFAQRAWHYFLHVRFFAYFELPNAEIVVPARWTCQGDSGTFYGEHTVVVFPLYCVVVVVPNEPCYSGYPKASRNSNL